MMICDDLICHNSYKLLLLFASSDCARCFAHVFGEGIRRTSLEDGDKI